MLQKQVEGRAREAADIDSFRVIQPFSQVRAYNPLVPGFRAESGLSQAGIDPEIQVRASDIGLVVIERVFVRRIAE